MLHGEEARCSLCHIVTMNDSLLLPKNTLYFVVVVPSTTSRLYGAYWPPHQPAVHVPRKRDNHSVATRASQHAIVISLIIGKRDISVTWPHSYVWPPAGILLQESSLDALVGTLCTHTYVRTYITPGVGHLAANMICHSHRAPRTYCPTIFEKCSP